MKNKPTAEAATLFEVVLISRKAFSGQYSIEQVFQQVVPHLQQNYKVRDYRLPYPSKGLWPRIQSALAARRHQGKVNHITGDITYVAPFLKGRKTIVTVHDCGFVHRAGGIKKGLLKFFWLTWPCRHAQIVTAISETTKRDLLQLVRLPAGKVRVVPNPLTLVKEAEQRTSSPNNPKPVILHIGTKANKNLQRLIPALQGLEVTLHIVGKLNDRQFTLLEEYAIDYRNSWNLTDSELLEKYRQADLLAFVSTIEGFGLPIIEAQALGCPVLTSNCSSMPEVAGAGAHLVDPYETPAIRAGILRLLEDRPYREHLIEQGYRNIGRFRPQAIARRYLALYDEILADT